MSMYIGFPIAPKSVQWLPGRSFVKGWIEEMWEEDMNRLEATLDLT